MDALNYETVKQTFGRIVYSHKTHEKEVESLEQRSVLIKWSNIVIVSCVLIVFVWQFLDPKQTCLAAIGSFLTIAEVIFLVYQLSFKPDELAQKHRMTAKELLLMRDLYIAFLTDIKNESIGTNEIILKRDNLIEKLMMVYKFAPQTSKDAYKNASESLNDGESLNCDSCDFENFLPEQLR